MPLDEWEAIELEYEDRVRVRAFALAACETVTREYALLERAVERLARAKEDADKQYAKYMAIADAAIEASTLAAELLQ